MCSCMVFMFGEAKASGCCAAVLPRKVSLRGRARPAAGSALRFCCWGFCSINPLRAYGVLVPRDPGGAGAAALALPTSIPRGGAEHPSLCWGLASKQGDEITLLPSPAGRSGDAGRRVERMEGRQSAAVLWGSGGAGGLSAFLSSSCSQPSWWNCPECWPTPATARWRGWRPACRSRTLSPPRTPTSRLSTSSDGSPSTPTPAGKSRTT